MTMTTTNPDWDRTVKIIDGADEVCLACHIRPDADALGSMLALVHALSGRKVVSGRRARVVASFGEQPADVPAALRFLPGTGLLSQPVAYPARPAVMLSLDASSIDRLGLLAGAGAAAGELIVLDHHASNTGFGTINLVDPGAAATTVLARELIRRLDVPLTPDIALCLYTGLVADTGSFKFSSTTPQVHQLAAELLSAGVDAGTVSRNLYDRAPFSYLGMLAASLGRATLEPEVANGRGLVWTTVTRTDRDRAGLPLEAADAVIDELRRTEEAEVAVVLKEADDNTWQASVRSKSEVDVSKPCAALGGGGHVRAAGFAFAGSPDAAITALKRELDPK
jgi:bifunctional oligoribonuclease and PAP phosphatase NrnA